MEVSGNRIVYAASDLVDFVACAHLAELGRRVLDGELRAPAPSEQERLVARKGDAHEAAELARLRAAGRTVVEIPRAVRFEERRAAAARTLAALQRGAEIVYGATFVDLPAVGEGWSGVADFLIRVDAPSRLGSYRYDVWDAKLARSAKPSALLQLCVYAELLAKLQGIEPQRLHLALGDGRVESFATAEVMPYYLAAKARFVAQGRSAARTYPDPVPHCVRCRWSDACAQRRSADDRLSQVAHLRKSQAVKLHAAGIVTASALAAAPDDARPRKLDRATFGRLRAQASLQAAARDGVPRYELLPPGDGCGFARLPEPDPGDLYFDMEGDPFYDGGLEYLFGVADAEGGTRRFTWFAGHDRAAEKRAFEAFVDFTLARRALHPNLHVYHYASYEASALRRLATQHATREHEIDTLLREGVLVDLYDVVRQSVRASFESYSLKKIEQFYRGPRDEEVTSAMGSVVAYERYLETREPGAFDEILAYNREDCYSTLELHGWLTARKAEAEALYGAAIPWRATAAVKDASDDDLEADGLGAQLLAGIDAGAAGDDEPARVLAAHLLQYHRREAKPAWWAFFDRLERKTVDELIDDAEALGDLEPLDAQPELLRKSQVYTLRFPPQEHKLKPGRAFDPALGKAPAAGTILDIDDGRGIVRLLRGPSLASAPLPRALCAPGPIQDDAQRGALVRFGRELLQDDCRSRFRAARDLLYAAPPRFLDRPAGSMLDDGALAPEDVARLTLALDDSYLFVQGPPGSGKTWTGARAIVALIARGLRVGIASTSHKAIHNLLAEVEAVAVATNVTFRGYKKASTPEAEYSSPAGFITNAKETALCARDAGAALVAGTAWLFCDAQMENTLDVLAIDEAGQVSLADAVAMGTAARRLLLLGDPMQLAQVAQAQHPEGAGASVLTHLLGDRATVPPDRGIFLPHSFRMHDDICGYVSALAYDGRLAAGAGCRGRRIDAPTISGAGLRYLPVAHEGNVQSSPEEAAAIASAVEELLGGSVTDDRGRARPLLEGDILVVTPYNANVRCVRAALDANGRYGVRAGTVDKFQGQQAPVVFYSTASSRGDELPRGIGFLFERRRLNVAVSRAQALAVLVCAPALLETPANSVDQLVTIGALCRFAQIAKPLRFLDAVSPRQLSLIA